MVVEKFDHVTSLMASLAISLIPVVLFLFMPETLGVRTHYHVQQQQRASKDEPNYRPMDIRACRTDTTNSYGSFD